MRFREGSSPLKLPPSVVTVAGDPRGETLGLPGRLLLWLASGLIADATAPIPVRVFYKFDSGRWRSRVTRQLHKVYRCR